MRTFRVADLAPIAGVYKIECTKTNRCYIGQSIDVMSRLREHVRQLGVGTHRRKGMQQDWQAFGGESFLFHVIQVLPNPSTLELLSAERNHIFTRFSQGAELYLSTKDAGTLNAIKNNSQQLENWLGVCLSPITQKERP